MLSPITNTPVVVVTGIRRAGLNLLACMLRAGGIPDERIVLAPDPHIPAPVRANVATGKPVHCVGIYVDRSTTSLVRSTERHNAEEARPELSLCERRALQRRFAHDLKRARDAAVERFAPLYSFAFENVIEDPTEEAKRLKHILRDCDPQFSTIAAALAVRRIFRLQPRETRAPFRVVKP